MCESEVEKQVARRLRRLLNESERQRGDLERSKGGQQEQQPGARFVDVEWLDAASW